MKTDLDPWWDRHFNKLFTAWVIICLGLGVAFLVVATHFVAKWW
jgi:hypothetical protein